MHICTCIFFFLEMLQNKANLQTKIQLVVFTSWWHSKTALLRRTERQIDKNVSDFERNELIRFSFVL